MIFILITLYFLMGFITSGAVWLFFAREDAPVVMALFFWPIFVIILFFIVLSWALENLFSFIAKKFLDK